MPDSTPPYGVTACPCGGEGHEMSTRCEACGERFAEHYNHACFRQNGGDRSADTFRPAPPVECATCLCDCDRCGCEDAYCWRCACGIGIDPECEDCGCSCDECACEYDGCGSCGCGIPDDDDDGSGYCQCENCEANDDYVRASIARRGLVT